MRSWPYERADVRSTAKTTRSIRGRRPLRSTGSGSCAAVRLCDWGTGGLKGEQCSQPVEGEAAGPTDVHVHRNGARLCRLDQQGAQRALSGADAPDNLCGFRCRA